MIVVAGPPGGGKSTAFPRAAFTDVGIAYFNIDDRCKELHGSSKNIPPEVRLLANEDLAKFGRALIAARQITR